LNGSAAFGVCIRKIGTGITSFSGYGGPVSINNYYFMARGVGVMGRMFPSSTSSPTINGTFSMLIMGVHA